MRNESQPDKHNGSQLFNQHLHAQALAQGLSNRVIEEFKKIRMENEAQTEDMITWYDGQMKEGAAQKTKLLLGMEARWRR